MVQTIGNSPNDKKSKVASHGYKLKGTHESSAKKDNATRMGKTEKKNKETEEVI